MEPIAFQVALRRAQDVKDLTLNLFLGNDFSIGFNPQSFSQELLIQQSPQAKQYVLKIKPLNKQHECLVS